MKRDLIHPGYPFTEEEHAAAWILLGQSAANALAQTRLMRAQMLAEDLDAGPIQFEGGFGAVIHIVAHVLSDGSVVSDTARDAWLLEWTLLVEPAVADERLRELDRLGPRVRAYRPVFRRLLIEGSL